MAIVLGAPPLLTACGGESGAGPTQPAKARPEPDKTPEEAIVRVRVRRVGELGSTVKIGAKDQWLAFERGDSPKSNAVVKGPVVLSVTSHAWRVRDAQGNEQTVDGLETLEFSVLKQDKALILLGDTPYPGKLKAVALLAHDDKERATGFDIVNYVSLEQYLPGVLAKELYAHWDPQTFAAQAIASRSFACSEHAYFRDRRHYDLTDTQASQMYVGATRHGRSKTAVLDTEGQVLMYQNKLVPGYYSSCCGGLAAMAIDAIGRNPINDTPPLRGHDGQDVCTEAPVYRWHRNRTKSDMLQRLRGYGKAHGSATLESLTGLDSIEVADTNPHGRPTAYHVRGPRNEVAQIEAVRLRPALDYTHSGGKPPEHRMWSSYIYAHMANRDVKIEGCGFGHGVGLCQYGAEALAKTGSKAKAILAWYYPNAEIVKAY
jgi:stage II sporulation protein D